jgi:hypothetical protein
MGSIYKSTKSGFCRICGKYNKLTEDHIPPEKCFNQTTIFVNKPYDVKIDRGLRIRSICEDCNSNLLGGNYDNELKQFVKEIDKYYKLRYRDTVVFKKAIIKINKLKVMRSILGHVLSCYGSQDELSSEIELSVDCYSNRMRRFVIGDNNNFCNEIKFVFWLHPYRTIRVVPNVVLTELYNSETSLGGSLFSFYPIGIFIINKTNFNLLNKFKLNVMNIDGNDEQEVDINSVQDENFPFSLLKKNNGVGFLFNSKGIVHGVKSEYFQNSKILRPGTY